MSPKTLRIIGIACCVTAAILAILNLKRTADLGLKTFPFILLILGVGLAARARMLEKKR